jgi:transcriptional regulator with XRE-family HTH domain
MYNGQVIKDLLEKQKKSNKELLAYLGKDVPGGNSYLRTLVTGNPTVKTLEPVADFFGVSMDVFFNRERNLSLPSTSVVGDGNAVGSGNTISASSHELDKRLELLEKLVDDKDKRIETLELLVQFLRGKADI